MQDVSKLVERFASDQQRRGLLPSTIEKRTHHVSLFARSVSSVLEATEEDVESFLASRTLGDRAYYSWISHLHAFYVWAIRRGYTRDDPTIGIDRPRLRQGLPRPISDGDLAMALAVAPRLIRTWVTLAAFAGLRCLEIAALERESVLDTLEEPMLRVMGKGRKERMIPAHPAVLDSLRLYGMPRTGWLFRSAYTGERYSAARVSQLSNRFLHDIGIDATMHQCRHWFGTKTYQACHDIRVVQELLGHSSPTVTAIYTAFSKPDARRAVMDLHRPGEDRSGVDR